MESTVSLYEVLKYLRNFFPGERWSLNNAPIQAGSVELPGLELGSYYLIEDSRRNDGLHIYGEPDLIGESLSGYVTECCVPGILLALVGEIEAWQEKYSGAIASPFQSESFGGYSYTKKSGSTASGTVTSWQDAFASRLRVWRKV